MSPARVAVAASGECDREERGRCRSGTKQVDGQAVRAHGVDEGEEDGRYEQRRHPEEGDERGVAKVFPRLALDRLSPLERPVRELCRHEQACCVRRRGTIERGVVDGELSGVQAADEDNGRGDEWRPVERDAGDESDESDGGDPHTGSLQGVTRSRQRNGCQRTEACNARGTGRYTRASLA